MSKNQTHFFPHFSTNCIMFSDNRKGIVPQMRLNVNRVEWATVPSLPCILASTYSKPFMVFVTLVLNLASPNSWNVNKVSQDRGDFYWGEMAESSFCPTSQTALHSTDLNGSRKPKDVGRDPGFPFNLRPAAILRVDFIVAALFYRLTKGNKWTQNDDAII